MKLLVDANVLMDVLAEREPFQSSATGVWVAAEAGRIVGVVSALTVGTVYYLARRLFDRPRADAAVMRIMNVFEIAPVDRDILAAAARSGMTDFEDAIQAFAGARSGAGRVVTRDRTGFNGGPIPVITPDELLAELAAAPPPLPESS